ncbi:MAG: DUF1517 domain-containing protein, partial [Deltaproteobacteria bacterium]|nr:DUF1517 domain-containing protein [Deltaproteobacteria bacterium]
VDAIALAHKFDERLARLHELYAYEEITTDGTNATALGPLRGDSQELGASVLALMVVRTEAPAQTEISDADEAKKLLADLASGKEQLVAWDLGWGPRDFSERLSMTQLTSRFPELSRIAEPKAELPAATAELVARWS